MIALAVTALVTVASLALYALVATKQGGNEKAARAELAVRIEALTAANTDLATRLKDEKERADALDDLIAEMAIVGPVPGAYERLLQRWATGRPGDRARAVPAPTTATKPGPDDLLPPGE